MANINLSLPIGESVVTGKQITFQAPCNSDEVNYIDISGDLYELVDAIGNPISKQAFIKDAMVSIIVNVETKKAFIQNAASINEHTHPVASFVMEDRPLTDFSYEIHAHESQVSKNLEISEKEIKSSYAQGAWITLNVTGYVAMEFRIKGNGNNICAWVKIKGDNPVWLINNNYLNVCSDTGVIKFEGFVPEGISFDITRPFTVTFSKFEVAKYNDGFMSSMHTKQLNDLSKTFANKFVEEFNLTRIDENGECVTKRIAWDNGNNYHIDYNSIYIIEGGQGGFSEFLIDVHGNVDFEIEQRENCEMKIDEIEFSGNKYKGYIDTMRVKVTDGILKFSKFEKEVIIGGLLSKADAEKLFDSFEDIERLGTEAYYIREKNVDLTGNDKNGEPVVEVVKFDENVATPYGIFSDSIQTGPFDEQIFRIHLNGNASFTISQNEGFTINLKPKNSGGIYGFPESSYTGELEYIEAVAQGMCILKFSELKVDRVVGGLLSEGNTKKLYNLFDIAENPASITIENFKLTDKDENGNPIMISSSPDGYNIYDNYATWGFLMTFTLAVSGYVSIAYTYATEGTPLSVKVDGKTNIFGNYEGFVEKEITFEPSGPGTITFSTLKKATRINGGLLSEEDYKRFLSNSYKTENLPLVRGSGKDSIVQTHKDDPAKTNKAKGVRDVGFGYNLTLNSSKGVVAVGGHNKASENYQDYVDIGTEIDPDDIGKIESSFVSGYTNILTAKYSFVSGNQNRVFGTKTNYQSSALFGSFNTVRGSTCLGAGQYNDLRGASAFAFGEHLKAKTHNTVVGRYNEEVSGEGSAYFIVGYGTGENNRRNAFVISSEGGATFGENVYLQKGKGVVLTSPNGTRYKLTVEDSEDGSGTIKISKV